MDIFEVKTEEHGMGATHNMPCPVCHIKHAMLNMNRATFGPCDSCKIDGWELVKRPRKVGFWLKLWRWTLDSIFDPQAYELVLVESNSKT